MYQSFVLRNTEDGKIEGYSWPKEEPSKIVCIVHGIGEYGGRFDRVAEEFRDGGMAVLALDLRGHGNSLGKKGHCAPRKAVLEDISALIEYAQDTYPGKDIILYGHSMGGNIVLDYRSRGRLNGAPHGYIITGPWIRLVRPVPASIYKVVKAMSKVMPSFTIGSDVDEEELGHPDSVKPYKDNPMVHNRISALCAVEGFEIGLKLEGGSIEDDGAAKKTPTLLMHGGADKICSIQGSRCIAQRLEKAGDNIEYVEWEGLFHEIHNGNAEGRGEEVIAKMAEWITALE
ncbi:MAG: alpha/beta hydrolase [Clostridiales bacterium]|nr:alpha/beta hydrolase [Clostridiales bacterium]